MHRVTSLEVTLRQREQLRAAEQLRWAATVRRTHRRSSRIARALGFRSAETR